MSTKPPSKSVFVGNIPYGLTEEQIVDIFSSAGKVLNFRLVYDRETGRPKGFGFAEYPDSDSASSAVRNLNDYEIMNRKLRLLDVLSQMKTLASTDPAKATELLHQAPQLSYAIFQALLLMGLVSTDALTSVVEAATTAPPAAYAAAQQATAAQSAYPPGYPPPPPHMSGQLGMQIGTPPVQNHGYPPPPPARALPPQQQAAPAMPDQDALIQQVLAMSQEVIDTLPPAERSQLMALRAEYGR
ncbi:Cleavage stimulation factor subunit [Lachnellula suecica]|uniref:Cleavage stimulation factor subunit n=1 Tax=Lachnellula suecica TaxID=602035 RepID=A0A8T9C8G2_9HELO|nr:Cleavage stimulation factor subunit [Lachnellula suecica]